MPAMAGWRPSRLSPAFDPRRSFAIAVALGSGMSNETGLEAQAEPTEADREDAVHIHRPKPLKGVGGFLSEIAIIVVGILIALAGEQVVDNLEWAHRVHEVEGAMRAELAQNNHDAYYRLATHPCAVAKLDEIQAALVASRDRGAPVAPITRYRRPLRPWLSDEWENARSLQIASHIPNDRLSLYSQAYFWPKVLHDTQGGEREAMGDLNTLAVNAGRLEPAERDRLFHALVKTRDFLGLMDGAAGLMLRATAPVDVVLSEAEKKAELASAQQDLGACAVAPDLNQSP